MRKYTKEHEWVELNGDTATIGISEYAAEALGEVVYVELPKLNNSYKKGEACAVVESSKSASDVYAPISGTVTEVNEVLKTTPEMINTSTYQKGWIAKFKVSNSDEIKQMMDEGAYKKYLESK